MLLEEEAIAEAKESFSQAIHCREAVVGPYDAEVCACVHLCECVLLLIYPLPMV